MTNALDISFSVFTKPWKTTPIDVLADRIQKLGFDGIEFPLREGFQVEPRDAQRQLPELAQRLRGNGLQLFSVASALDESVFAACAAAGVSIIRTMTSVRVSEGWHVSLARERARLEAAIPLGEQYGIQIGVQNHIGECVANSTGLLLLMDGLDPARVGIIWDAAHNSLEGEEPEIGLSAVWDRLLMVNLKNAYRRRISPPDAAEAQWDTFFTTGSQGYASWRRVIHYLAEKRYRGVLCLTAEYSEEHRVDEYIGADLQYARALLAEAEGTA